MKNETMLVTFFAVVIVVISTMGLFFWFNPKIEMLESEIATLEAVTESNTNQWEIVDAYPELINNLLSQVVQIQSLEDGFPIVSGRGSGIIISEDGYVLTNAHVVGFGDANQFSTQISDDEEILDAQLIGVAACDDIALLKLPDDTYPFAEFSANSPQVGIPITSVGYAFDDFIGTDYPSANNGYVTRTNLSISNYFDLIQHDSGLNAGDSGGAIFDRDSLLIGMNSFRPNDSQGIGFAISASHLQTIYGQLLEGVSSPSNFSVGETSDVIELLHPLDRDCWHFEAIAGEVIQIDVVNVDPHIFEPDVLLYGPTNLLIGVGEATDDTRRSKQITITPQVNGVFTVMIGRNIAQQDRIGTYTISIANPITSD